MSDEDDDITEIESQFMGCETIELCVVSKDDLQDKEMLIAYRYLYWAAMRGHIFIIDHIMQHYAISPFLQEKEEQKSPFMVAIEHNQEKVVR